MITEMERNLLWITLLSQVCFFVLLILHTFLSFFRGRFFFLSERGGTIAKF